MTRQSAFILLALGFAAAAGYVYGGWHYALIGVLAMAAQLCYKFA